MTDPAGNSQFCFPETLNVPRGKCFVLSPNSKVEKKTANKCFALRRLTNLPRFQGGRPDQVRVESSCCSFTKELVSFARPSFDPRQVTRFPPIGKRIRVGSYNNSY